MASWAVQLPSLIPRTCRSACPSSGLPPIPSSSNTMDAGPCQSQISSASSLCQALASPLGSRKQMSEARGRTSPVLFSPRMGLVELAASCRMRRGPGPPVPATFRVRHKPELCDDPQHKCAQLIFHRHTCLRYRWQHRSLPLRRQRLRKPPRCPGDTRHRPGYRRAQGLPRRRD